MHSCTHLFIYLFLIIYLQIMEELLTAAVADAEVVVRKSVFQSLHEDISFDVFLCQGDTLSSIFIALNDEVFL